MTVMIILNNITIVESEGVNQKVSNLTITVVP